MSRDQRRDDSGATFLEYGLIVALIAAIVALAVAPFGTAVSDMFASFNF